MSVLRQYERLSAIRDVLQGKLELYEARDCFGIDDLEDGTTNDLRDRIAELSDGLDFVPIAMGLFGLGEVIANLERPAERRVGSQKVGDLIPGRAD
eukprot:gene35129-biopygen30546